MAVLRHCIEIIAMLVLVGCSGGSGRMERSEDPQGRYREHIAAAARVLRQEEDWADRAEWEVSPRGDGWVLTAWRVEHPEAKGSARYVPWGYAIIELDRRLVAVGYRKKG